ncbi:MAG: PD-(D/E)XK nuclease family protein [Undibacterium sp.]|nr:PD-(D/E)XK nuclease family protein [Undibacterium sp.]
MRHPPELVAASAQFWKQVAHRFAELSKIPAWSANTGKDYSAIRVVVPTFEHAQLFLQALTKEIPGNFIPPRINTMFAWLEMSPPLPDLPRVSANSERLMSLYAQLREQAWLKTLFGAKRNTDLLPLAQTLLNLADELTLALLPTVNSDKLELEKRWHLALAQLPLPVQKIVSDETQLVWSIWQSQLDSQDAIVQRYQKMMQIAKSAQGPLLWITPSAPDAMEQAFLDTYQLLQPVLAMNIDWHYASLPSTYASAWPDLMDAEQKRIEVTDSAHADMSNVRLYEAGSLEDEAQTAAQTIIEWLQEGKQKIAVIAQDRVVARRIRALLERASVHVADETGWKLSTTRAAAALAAWFEVVATRADTIALLDLLKSPYLHINLPDAGSQHAAAMIKADHVMAIELALRKSNVLGGWDAVLAALDHLPAEKHWVATIARQAGKFTARKSLKEWTAVSLQLMAELGLQASMQEESAGNQILQMLQALNGDCQHMDASFSFAEWRAFVNLQLESAPFISIRMDKRVVMLPLNGAHLRCFDAVFIVGADATHLPSRAKEVLFFTNAVRRECGLVTRETRQRQQLRDFAEVLLSNSEVVISWQGQHDGEHNSVSPWIAQLNLTLERNGLKKLTLHDVSIPQHTLQSHLALRPAPSAPELTPVNLSASGYSSLVACPYQFFAGRMLKLSAIDELSDMPEKRDYGDWLHAILKTYHDSLQAEPAHDREQLLREVSQTLFDQVLEKSPAALGYSVRWDKVIPAYVKWANEREAAGWKFEIGEVWREHQLSWDNGEILLRGRIDRIDHNAEGERAVLDYKTKTATALNKRLKEAEDHQLAFYGLLSEHPANAASYVALELDREKTGDVAAKDFAQWTLALKQSIIHNMQAIKLGAAMPAQGVESVCQYCDMRGLCRKGAW